MQLSWASPLPELSRRCAVLLVCTANLCRSPMAEGALRHMLRGTRADIDSAGTHDFGAGLPPHPLAIAATRERGYDISGFTGRQVRTHDFHYFDLIVAMDRRNLVDLRAACPPALRAKIVRLLDFNPLSLRRSVGDPFGGGPEEFEACLARIEAGCAGLAQYTRGRPFAYGDRGPAGLVAA